MIVNISDLQENTEQKIQVFVENIRDKANIVFLIVKDITGKIQVVVKKDNLELSKIVSQLTCESCITITGKKKIDSNIKLNGCEFVPSDIKIETIAASPLPLDSTSLIDQRIDFRWLDLRNEKNQLIFKIQTCVNNAMRDFLLKNKFIEIHSPKLIATASESGSELFTIEDYFGKKAYLAQSPQFYKQMAIIGGFEKVFEVAPVFRAEKSHTNRHTTEFTSFDVELSQIDDVKQVMVFEQDMIIYMLKIVKEQYGDKIKEVFGQEVIVPNDQFPILTLNEIYEQLEKNFNYKVPESEKGDLNSESEKMVYKLAKEKYNSEFMFVTEYAKEFRPFYHFRDEKDIPQGFDLIFKGTEITSGAKREHRYEHLKNNATEKGLTKDVQFYLDFFKFGCPPHGGFAIGLDRITMLILGITIKDVMLVYRGTERLNP